MNALVYYSVSSPVCGATIVSASELGGVCKAYFRRRSYFLVVLLVTVFIKALDGEEYDQEVALLVILHIYVHVCTHACIKV
jgi:hypothetical protein